MPRRTMVDEHLSEEVDFGGVSMPRGEMLNELMRRAVDTGHPQPQSLVNAYIGCRSTHLGTLKQERPS